MQGDNGGPLGGFGHRRKKELRDWVVVLGSSRSSRRKEGIE